MDSETKDTTDYVATITPELLNLSKNEDFEHEIELKCKVKEGCPFNYYLRCFMIPIFLFLLFQIVLKLKVLNYKLDTLYNLIVSISIKVDNNFKSIPKECPVEKTNDSMPNLKYILEIIQQIDKLHTK